MPKSQVADELSVADLRKTEFTALRNEIDRRSNAQLALMSVNLTAFGTLTGLALTGTNLGERLPLLLPLPIISACTGFMWVDHDRAIHVIGDYIGRSIWPPNIDNFERVSDAHERSFLPVALEFVVPVLLVFLLPAVIALLWTWHLPLNLPQKVLRYFGVGLSALYLITFLVRVIRRWHQANYTPREN